MPVEPQGAAGEKRATPPIDTGKARQINVTNMNGTNLVTNSRLCWTPDGSRIVYMSEESGNADIWSMNADGSDRRQLTTDPYSDNAAAVSPDGRHIAFMSNRAGAENIWLMNIDGGNQRRLTSKLLERVPSFSADGRWVYFVAWETRRATIWKIPVEGGEPTQVITDLSYSPFLSPDGKFLMYDSRSGKIHITPAEGGPPLKSFEARGWEYMWSPNGQALTYLSNRNNVTNLWEQPLDGGESRQLTNYTSGGINKYALSIDGKHLAVTQSKYTRDVVLINDLR
jgi:Tol biopolymer transport system component